MSGISELVAGVEFSIAASMTFLKKDRAKKRRNDGENTSRKIFSQLEKTRELTRLPT
jgi:hypothetical protein